MSCIHQQMESGCLSEGNVLWYSVQDSDFVQKSVPARILPDEARPKENTEPVLRGSIEAAVKLPVGTKSSGLNNEEDGVPVVAFKERRSLRTLSGLEEIQTHQRAEVI
ncbi:hypothetical protein KUCAC02_032812 [Chaenocephalus aceratus]|nr:hypothetical protein KUCAC02_032812 [Chaenocephalus aceratus]